MSFYNQSIFISIIIIVFTALIIFKNLDVFSENPLDNKEIQEKLKDKKPIHISINPSDPKDLLKLLMIFFIIVFTPYLNLIISTIFSLGIMWGIKTNK